MSLTNMECYDLLSLDELRDWMKIDTKDDDNVLEGIRMAAVEMVEKYTNRVLIARNITSFYEKFLSEDYENYDFLNIYEVPLRSIVQIQTMINDVYTTVDSSYYALKQSDNLPRVLFTTKPLYDTDVPYPIKVSYISGYGEIPQDVPEAIRTAAKMIALFMYENRGDVVPDGNIYMPLAATSLLNKYRVIQHF